MKRIRFLLLSTITIFGLILTPTIVMADSTSQSFHQDACGGLSQVDLGQGCGSNVNPVNNITGKFVTILSIVAGVLGVIMIIVSGFRFITSGGDSGKVASARTALIYALIGLVVAALSQFLAHYVISQSSDATTPCPGQSGIYESDPTCKATH